MVVAGLAKALVDELSLGMHEATTKAEDEGFHQSLAAKVGHPKLSASRMKMMNMCLLAKAYVSDIDF